MYSRTKYLKNNKCTNVYIILYINIFVLMMLTEIL